MPAGGRRFVPRVVAPKCWSAALPSQLLAHQLVHGGQVKRGLEDHRRGPDDVGGGEGVLQLC